MLRFEETEEKAAAPEATPFEILKKLVLNHPPKSSTLPAELSAEEIAALDFPRKDADAEGVN